jgi:hypothetical protein
MPISPWEGKTQKAFIAGWSSLVARQAHNLKVVSSNPVPATNIPKTTLPIAPKKNLLGLLCVLIEDLRV